MIIFIGIITVFLFSMLLGVPIVYSIILASGIPILLDSYISIGQMSNIILQQTRSFTLWAIPLYIYCGKLLVVSGVTDDIIFISKVLVGKVRGNLAFVNIITSIFFGGISGSSVADVTSLGTVIIPAMNKTGYKPEFSATLTAASATIGSIIPPSILLIVYGAIAQTSIAALFLGGIIPGILIGLVQMIYSYFYVIKNKIGFDTSKMEIYSVSMKIQAIIKSIFPISIFLIIIGGILKGIFTPTEAAGVAVVYIFFVSYFFKNKRNLRLFFDATIDAAKDTAVIFFVIICASFLSWVLTYYQVFLPIVNIIKTSNLNGISFLLILTLLYVILGTFMEPCSAMLIFVPLLSPVVDLLNLNPTAVGIITVMTIRVGAITPPYGLCSLVAARIANTNILKMTKLILTFSIFYVLVVVILIFFPDIILFLPRLLLPNLIYR